MNNNKSVLLETTGCLRRLRIRCFPRLVVIFLPILVLNVHPALTAEVAPLEAVTDATATESMEHWNNYQAPSLALSDEAKIGKHSIVGTFGTGQFAQFYRGGIRSWNLTHYEKLRFWARADEKNDGLLVMLITNGMDDRRDAAVALSADWQLYELPFDEKTFCKNIQGDSSFTSVKAIVFYNNSKKSKIRIDGLEFIGKKDTAAIVEPESIKLPDPTAGKLLTLVQFDPFPHLEEAKAGRYVVDPFPRYQLPPIAFNKENLFKDALINFDQATGWHALVYDADGYMCLSKDQMLRDVPNLKIEIVPTGKKPKIVLVPPEPMAITSDFDVVECWAYACKGGGSIAFQFRLKDGSLFTAGLNRGPAKGYEVVPRPIGHNLFWNLVRLVIPEKVDAGAKLVAIVISPDDRALQDMKRTLYFYLDQVRVQLFSEYIKNPPPAFSHTGPVVDNFPVTPDGACPRTIEPVTTTVAKAGDAYHLTYAASANEKIAYVYTPRTGTFDDLSVLLKDGSVFQPAYGSGPVFDFSGGPYNTVQRSGGRAELVACLLDGQTVRATWKYSGNAGSETIVYEFSLKGKTLQVAAKSEERALDQWIFGEAKGVKDARVIEIPFMNLSPNVLLTHGMFVTYYADWYRSNSSRLPYVTENFIKGDVAGYNWQRGQPQSGYCYFKRTDGLRHPFQEVFYITVSSNFDDVMLTVNNPPSPMKDALKKHLYRMSEAGTPGTFGRVRAFVDECEKYGMTNFYYLLHAALWTKHVSGSEAFPGDLTVSMLHETEGGDKGLQDLFKHMTEKGVTPGYYDGFPARSMTGPNCHYDWTSFFLPNGDWRYEWGLPVLKPWVFPELANTLYKERAKKYGPRVSYQDGITASIISEMIDFDHRYPESGTLRGTLKALATGWQRCRENVNGPVFSEGRGSDFYTAGLNDGDYSKLKGFWDEKPCTGDRVELLVDFRLKKLGLLSAPVGIDICYPAFAGDSKIYFYNWTTKEENYAYLHHFLATEIAFAAIGMLEQYWVLWDNPKFMFDKTITTYFLIQQLQERYIMEPVEEIKYFDGRQLLDTSAALRANVVKDNLVYVRYKNGLTLYINLNWDGKNWQIADDGKNYDLPPGGWYARQGKDFLEFSALINGNRVDFVDSPEYIYLDGCGKPAEINGLKSEHQAIKWKKGPKAGQILKYP